MLPIFITSDRSFVQMQNQWSAQLQPILNNALSSGLLLQNVLLTPGDNAVNHKLDRRLVGWFITRKRNAAVIFDKQDSNSFPSLTLVLNSDIDTMVDLYVF